MKIYYDGIEYDSELEVNYKKYLDEKRTLYVYQNQYKKHPIQINLGRRKTYVPDFIVFDHMGSTITIIELKGYAKWSANEDNNIMDFMKNKVSYDKQFLIKWLKEINCYFDGYEVKYQRIKHLKAYGWVDFDFKNPNTIANQRKEKIKVLEADKKASRNRLKDIDRYFGYLKKEKLTKPQKEWVNAFELENGLINLHRNYWRGI